MVPKNHRTIAARVTAVGVETSRPRIHLSFVTEGQQTGTQNTLRQPRPGVCPPKDVRPIVTKVALEADADLC